MIYTQNFKRITVLLSLLVVAGAVSAGWQEPTSTPTSGGRPAPLTTLSEGQWRENPLALGTTSAPLTNFMFDITGLARVNGAVASIFGDASIEGFIRNKELEHGLSSKEVCVNNSGELVLCTGSQQTQTVFIDSTPAGTEQFTVPSGVTEITVEIWGAGGGGFYYQNTNTGTSHNCTTSTSDYRIGGPTTFVSTLGASYALLTANGGKCAYRVGTTYTGNFGGAGGSATGAGSLIQSGSLTTISGEKGEDARNNGSSYTVPFTCSGSGNSLVLGGKGANGGAGGMSGPGSLSFTPEGSRYSVDGIDLVNCTMNYNGSGQVSAPYPPDVPISQKPGTGGSGAPGTGGVSWFVSLPSVDCPNSSWSCSGSPGYPGGGGGGYARVVLSVSPGDTFNYSIGTAQQSSYSANNAGYPACPNSSFKTVQNCGALSGYGSHGQVRITY